MTAQATLPASTTRPTPPAPRWRTPLVLGVIAVLLGLIAWNARAGIGGTRVANPAVSGHPRPVRPLWGFQHWIVLHEIGTVVMMVSLVVGMVIAWRRHPRHPYLLMTIAATGIVWQDPIMNWAPLAVYDPRLHHWPVTWPLASISPTVEPFIVIGYATFYFLGPFFPAMAIMRRLQARASRDSFVWRHPLVTLGALAFVCGFVLDAILEIFLVRTQLYIYSHVPTFGSVFTGKTYQFPLLVESSAVCLVMVPAVVLCYRDDTGRTQAEKLAQRFKGFAKRPALATFVVMFAILNVAYFAYGGVFAILRDARLTNNVACPYPYPEAKTYDPLGLYAKAGDKGPYFPGIWAGWESAQSGRPNVATAATGPCA